MKNKPPLVKSLKFIGVAAFWLLLWQAAATVIGKEVLLPAPISTIRAIIGGISYVSFWLSILYSLLRITGGFLLASVAGALLAVLTTRSAFFKSLFGPLLSIIKATPVASFIILTLIWLPSNTIPLWISFLMVLPIIWANVSKGLENTSKELLEMAAVFKMSSACKIRRIHIPSVMPYFMSGAITSIGMAWKAGVAAEVLCTPRVAIGTNLYNAKVYLETPEMFAWTVVIIILSIFIERVFVLLMKRAGRKYNVAEK